MNQSELYSLALSAGLPADKAKIAAAIAMAESGGNPNNHNNNPATGDDSYGLWQINMIGSVGPNRRLIYHLSSNADLFNPQTNARVMSSISQQGKNFNAWTTYTRGTYKQYLNNAVSTVSAAGGSGTDTSGPNLLDAAGNVVSQAASQVDTLIKVGTAVTKAGAWVSNPSNWIRVAYVGGGIMLVTLGLYAVINSTSTGKAVTQTAVKGAEKAAVVAAA